MNIEQTNNSGIKCDNPNCDFVDTETPDAEIAQWLGVPCPKCGENLLTQEDLDTSLKFHAMMDLINGMTEEELTEYTKHVYGGEIPEEIIKLSNELGNEFTVDIHNGITIVPKQTKQI